MNAQSESEPHEIVDYIEDRHTLWEQFAAQQDCTNCPQRRSVLPIKFTACFRCFDKYRDSLAAKPAL